MSSTAPQSVRQRGAQPSKKQTTAPASNGAADTLSDTLSKVQKEVKHAVSSEWDYKLALAVITVLAFATRFYGISHPNQVVFDEVHFGKFASYYLQRTYFFDVHPPFGKLLFAFAGWLVGYKGEFLFDNIGDSYVTNKVPYVAYRSMPALMGSLTVTTTFLIICVISTKYVGAFTFFSIGVPVAIDLWDLLDVNRRQGPLALPQFGKHLGARVIGLIVVPFFFYLFWFQVHFAILNRSGPGDDFMSPEFQETLSDNIMSQQSVSIDYFDSITLRHKETKVYLHSHLDKYPLRYDDGRISSQGQQVTGYPHNDTNNHWQILPATGMANEAGHRVKNGDLVRLRHLVTDTMLLTHDVASPYHPTNQEFTAVPLEEANGERFNDTLFEIRIENGKAGQDFKSMASHFKLVHHPTKVAMWTHTTPLPDWAYKQAEINGNKNVQQSSNIWYVEEIPSLPADSDRLVKEPRKTKHVPFLKKYFELQRAMFFHNNALTSSHPYASFPIQWPFLLRGVSFWTENDTRQQIYFLGNPVGWWLASSLLAVFAGIIGADQLSQRRGVDALDERTRSRLYNSTGFFFLTWAAHYIPFFVMGRQLFLHHYLPAHLASCLVTGALIEFVFNIEPVSLNELSAGNATFSTDGKKPSKKTTGTDTPVRSSRPVRERLGQQNLMASWAAAAVILAVVVWSFWFFAPLTYGSPGLDIDQVNARKWLNYDLHFAK
ncbi:hypothetical protein B0A49_00563 [Cryomyces minteri]|uniref:Dolichyl-phosphate-mannose--protein mannosyltransferase n=1 Tax=Cryomyces minteri TaxID=331657 RepID=A0A4V5NHW3_9PEZI|nr:hypothetical protein B0A49_00563 [Cryomyces minteri]